MRITLAKTTVVVAALVAATVVGLSTDTPHASAAGGPAWPIETYGTPKASDNVVLKWDEQLLSTIRAYPPQTGPTITARALAVMHTAMYDAWAAYDPTADPATPGAPGKHAGGAAEKEEAMSYAAYRMLVDVFPTRPRPPSRQGRLPDPGRAADHARAPPGQRHPARVDRRPAWATRPPRR